MSVSAKVEILDSSNIHNPDSEDSLLFAKVMISIILVLFESSNYDGRVVIALRKSCASVYSGCLLIFKRTIVSSKLRSTSSECGSSVKRTLRLSCKIKFRFFFLRETANFSLPPKDEFY